MLILLQQDLKGGSNMLVKTKCFLSPTRNYKFVCLNHNTQYKNMFYEVASIEYILQKHFFF